MYLNCTSSQKIQWKLKRRVELLYNKEIPSHSDIFESLGNLLGPMVFETMNPLSKELIRRVQGELTLPVVHSEISKARIHDEILELGKQVEEKVEKAYTKLIERAIDDSRYSERFENERLLQFRLCREREKHQCDINQIRKEFNDALKNEQNKFSKKLIKSSAQKEEKEIQTVSSIQTDAMPEKNIELNSTLQCLFKDLTDHLSIYFHLFAESDKARIQCQNEIEGSLLCRSEQDDLHTHLPIAIEEKCALDENERNCCGQPSRETPFSKRITAAIVYPNNYADNVFCNCPPYLQDSDEDFVEKCSKFKDTTKNANIEWSTVSEKSVGKTESASYFSSTENESVFGDNDVPLNCKLGLAKMIVSLANMMIDEIIKAALEQMRNISEKSYRILGELISVEFRRKFNEHIVLKTIEDTNNNSKSFCILGAADSVELLRTKKNSKLDTTTNTVPRAVTEAQNASSMFTSIAEKVSINHATKVDIDCKILNGQNKNSENEKDDNEFSHRLYRECTDEELKSLLKQICERTKKE